MPCPSINQKIFRQIQIGLDLSKLFWIVPKNVFSLKSFSSQNSQQKSVPDLYVVTVAFLALKKLVFFTFSEPPKKISKFFFFRFLCSFLVRTLHYSFFKKLKKKFFDPEKVKKPPKKVAQNRPRPLFPTVQPRPQPTAQNQFPILRTFGTRHLFSYL